VDMNLRGRFTTSMDGKYKFYCLRPTTYAILDDGPAGDLLELLNRHLMRPAHIHFIVSAPGYRSVVTELFDRQDKYVYDDAVFAVRVGLIVDFIPLQGDEKASYEAQYDSSTPLRLEISCSCTLDALKLGSPILHVPVNLVVVRDALPPLSARGHPTLDPLLPPRPTSTERSGSPSIDKADKRIRAQDSAITHAQPATAEYSESIC